MTVYVTTGRSSDVEVLYHERGWLQCSGCLLEPGGGSPRTATTQAMIDHLREHRRCGHDVPDDLFSDLERDRMKNDARMAAG